MLHKKSPRNSLGNSSWLSWSKLRRNSVVFFIKIYYISAGLIIHHPMKSNFKIWHICRIGFCPAFNKNQKNIWPVANECDVDLFLSNLIFFVTKRFGTKRGTCQILDNVAVVNNASNSIWQMIYDASVSVVFMINSTSVLRSYWWVGKITRFLDNYQSKLEIL